MEVRKVKTERWGGVWEVMDGDVVNRSDVGRDRG